MAPLAIIAGVGPGTGAAVARKFALKYPVVLLARNPANYEPLVEEIEKSGGKAVGISTDVSSPQSVEDAFKKIKGMSDEVAAGVFNVGGRFIRGPFLEMSLDDFQASYDANGKGAFLFSQHILPLLLNTLKSSPAHPPTLIFTGATASLRGSAGMSSFATGKFAKRALAQSLGREFGPKGVHVSHAIIDGLIDTERAKDLKVSDEPDAKISANAVSNSMP
ncbi:hypothetical protein MMC13_001935 [Lambiella insularis]|nr:hypothetical protein [Lambiella insularis]